jgi:GTP diphosphokinase / guanosine-3',5'-bis(diphosphate) 3'-diphosphatase
MALLPLEDDISEKSPETVDELLEKIKKYNPNADVELVRKAYEFSDKAHSGQVRRSGEPYIIHPLGVAGILADLRLDVSSIMTGLLHDTVEDTGVSLEQIEKLFGSTVRELVDGVTKLGQMKFRHTHEKQGENIRKMIVAMGKDVRVILVKLADRLHNMRTLGSMPFEKQKRIAEETLDIYAPLAGRLGINSLKIELEDLSFRYAQPDQYYDLVQKVNKKKKEREKYIQDVIEFLSREIKSRSQFPFDVFGRPKHLYSIYKKVSTRDVDYDQIYDLLAFRVILNSVSECYEVLGIVHSLWKPIPGRFKDFIAMPKTNNYQSLHTTVIGPGGERIEVQIRTREMHMIAEWGIAAHWKYKEDSRGGRESEKLTAERMSADKFNWLRELVSMHQQTNNADEFLENIKTDLTESEIYVFTPKGEVKELPDGATPIDFAFSVHTDVGSRVVAARVNGRIVTLKHRLRNGDTVEVITSKTQHPSKDWLKMCITTRAKSKIRAFVKTEQRKRALELGREIVERGFRKAGVPLQKSFEGPKYDKLLKDQGCQSLDELYIRVGYGKITPQTMLEALSIEKPKAEEPEKESFLSKAVKSAVNRSKKATSIISVDGMDDVLVRYAKCCLPIPGDPIVGFISRGRGITIHRADCQKAYEIDTARAVDVDWNTESPKGGVTPERMVRVKVTSEDKAGLLKNMSEVFAAKGCNIHNVQARTTRDRRAISIFDISVKDVRELSELMNDLQRLPGVTHVQRTNLNDE